MNKKPTPQPLMKNHKELREKIMREALKVFNELLNESKNYQATPNDDASQKRFDLNRNIISDIPEMKKKLKKIKFDKYIEPTYKNVLNFLKKNYGFVYNWEYSYEGDLGISCWNHQSYIPSEDGDLSNSWRFDMNRYDEVKEIYDNRWNEEWNSIVTLIDDMIERVIDKLDSNKERRDDEHKTFDLDRDFSKDFPEYKNRLLEIDFPEYEEMTYENVLDFFQNYYNFKFSWYFTEYPSYFGETEESWFWSARCMSQTRDNGVSRSFPTTFQDVECENEEQEAIFSIIDYILNKIENLDF